MTIGPKYVNELLDRLLQVGGTDLQLYSGHRPKANVDLKGSYSPISEDELEEYLKSVGIDPLNPLRNKGWAGGFRITSNGVSPSGILAKFEHIGKRDQSATGKILAVDLSGKHLGRKVRSVTYRDKNKTSKPNPVLREYTLDTVAHLKNGAILINGGDCWLRPDTELTLLISGIPSAE